MPAETDFYIWSPIFFQSKNPETGIFFGNVIGNFSLEDQLMIVDDEGSRQKTNVQNTGEEYRIAIELLSLKFIQLWQVVDGVEKAITGEDPVEREDGSDFIDSFLENYVPPSDEIPIDETDDPSDETEEVSSGAEYYIWEPNFFQIKKPDTYGFFGNVIGNVPASEQIQFVSSEGLRQKTEIEELGTASVQDIIELSGKFRYITNLNSSVMKEIIAHFGGVFVLDSSALNSAPLG